MIERESKGERRRERRDKEIEREKEEALVSYGAPSGQIHVSSR